MAALWTNDEIRTLTENIVDGFPVQRMKDLIPDREIGGIKQKAQLLGYGVKTSKIDDMARFYSGINTRNRGSNISTETDDHIDTVDTIQLTEPIIAIQHLEPQTEKVSYDGFTANELAVRMLQDNGLKANPEIIRYLSIHILGGEI